MDRGGSWSVCNGRSDLRFPAKGLVFARPLGRTDGPAELFVCDRHPDCRPRLAMEFLSAWVAGPSSVRHVRSVMVRWALCDDPAARIPTHPIGTMGPEESDGSLEPLVRCIRGIRRDPVCLSPVAQLDLRGAGCPVVLVPCMVLPRERQESRTHNAGHCRCDALDHAPEFPWIAVPADAGQTCSTMVVSSATRLFLHLFDCSRHCGCDPG